MVANVLSDCKVSYVVLLMCQIHWHHWREDFDRRSKQLLQLVIPCGWCSSLQIRPPQTEVQRGMAGGYAGHNEGRHIWGNNTKKWKGEEDTGPTSTCKAVRIRSVYGEEIAGGFTGLWSQLIQQVPETLSLVVGTGKVDNILRTQRCLSDRRKYDSLRTTCPDGLRNLEQMGEICR